MQGPQKTQFHWTRLYNSDGSCWNILIIKHIHTFTSIKLFQLRHGCFTHFIYNNGGRSVSAYQNRRCEAVASGPTSLTAYKVNGNGPGRHCCKWNGIPCIEQPCTVPRRRDKHNKREALAYCQGLRKPYSWPGGKNPVCQMTSSIGSTLQPWPCGPSSAGCWVWSSGESTSEHNGFCSAPCLWVQAEQDHYTGLCITMTTSDHKTREKPLPTARDSECHTVDLAARTRCVKWHPPLGQHSNPGQLFRPCGPSSAGCCVWSRASGESTSEHKGLCSAPYFVSVCVCVTMKKGARRMANTTSDTGDTSSKQQQAQCKENYNKRKRPVSSVDHCHPYRRKKRREAVY